MIGGFSDMIKESVLTRKEISQKIIKGNIKKQMFSEDIGVFVLSKKININIFILFFLLYTPFLKLKLNRTLKICKALKIGISDIVY